MSDPVETVRGHRLPAPRLTKAAKRLIVTRLVLPFLLVLALLDLLIWAVARYGFDSCYGVWCWL
jgi:flagellar biogenesis protein FliO